MPFVDVHARTSHKQDKTYPADSKHGKAEGANSFRPLRYLTPRLKILAKLAESSMIQVSPMLQRRSRVAR